MCGIVGFTGKQQAVPVLLQGLTTLEYRGYDSAGVTLQTAKGIETIKTHPLVPKDIVVRGFIIDSETGALEEIV